MNNSEITTGFKTFRHSRPARANPCQQINLVGGR